MKAILLLFVIPLVFSLPRFNRLLYSSTNYALPSTGGYYVNTGTVVPGVVPRALPTTGGYYVNTGGVVPIPGVVPTTGGYYVNTETIVPTVAPSIVPSTGGYYINTGTVIPGGYSMTAAVETPIVSPYGMTGGVYSTRPVATQGGLNNSTTLVCDESCGTCSGVGSNECLTCAAGKFPQRLEGRNTLVCLDHPPSL